MSRAHTRTIPAGPFSSLFCSFLQFGRYSSPGHVQTRTSSNSLTRSFSFSVSLDTLLTPTLIQEIDELVDEWTPEPLGQPLTPQEQADLAAVPVIAGPNGPKPKLLNTGKTAINLASFNFTGLSGNEEIKERAVDILRKYGLGSCGPPGFYGTLGAFSTLNPPR